MDQPTIAAISTPLGPGGIGIIRISGSEAYAILNQLFVHAGQPNGNDHKASSATAYTSHRVYYGHIVDPQSGSVIDEVLVVYMQAPRSFTREDVVEIQSHSGFVVLDRLLNAVLDCGATLSDPGEFTQRAFLNGRIDLTQAEAVIDLINAPCEAAVRMANRQMAGNLKAQVGAIIAAAVSARAQLEADLEFLDAETGGVDPRMIQDNLQQAVLAPINRLIQAHVETAIYRDGVHLSIVGVPNVGKSSLLNQLVQKETAIVSEVPGTTRDIIREYVSINGIPVVVHDTAGLHDSDDPIESIGIQKAFDQIERSDILLLVVDATRALSVNEATLIDKFKKMKTLLLVNKIDLVDQAVIQRRTQQIDHPQILPISAKTGQGLEAVKKHLFQGIVAAEEIMQSEQAMPNLRQRRVLEGAQREIQAAIQTMQSQGVADIVSERLQAGIQQLQEISGQRNEDLYDYIFGQFCIGK